MTHDPYRMREALAQLDAVTGDVVEAPRDALARVLRALAELGGDPIASEPRGYYAADGAALVVVVRRGCDALERDLRAWEHLAAATHDGVGALAARVLSSAARELQGHARTLAREVAQRTEGQR